MFTTPPHGGDILWYTPLGSKEQLGSHPQDTPGKNRMHLQTLPVHRFKKKKNELCSSALSVKSTLNLLTQTHI
jgi:hypothetical protein